MFGICLSKNKSERTVLYVKSMVLPIIDEIPGLAAIEHLVAGEPLPVTYPEYPVICFGMEAFDLATNRIHAEKFSTLRGTSEWINGIRHILTYEPEYVYEHPDVWWDFYNDIVLPIRYPITTEPVVNIRSQIVPSSFQAVEALGNYFKANPGTYTFDIETSGFRAHVDKILCISIGISEQLSWVLTPACWETEDRLEILKQIFSNPKVQWIAHNGKFDIRFMRRLLGFAPYLTHDTMLLHYTLDERVGTHGLKHLCSTRLALPDYEKELHSHLRRKSDSFDTIPSAILYKYAGQDTCFTFRLWHQLNRELADSPFYANLVAAYNLLMEASNVLGDIETYGFEMDLAALEQVKTTLTSQCAADEETLSLLAGSGFNPRSFKQVAVHLYDVAGFQEVKLFRNNKPRSTSAEALKKLQIRYPESVFLKTLLHYRETKKILSTYVISVLELIDPDGRLRTDFKLHGTVTGRLASGTPNLQNVPRPKKNPSARLIRNMFIAGEGNVLIGADYSQAELRVAATFAKEDRMRAIWAENRDMHTETCLDLFGETYTSEDRMIAKMLNFGVIYGRTAGSIAVERGIPMYEAVRLLDKFFDSKPKLKNWLDNIRVEAQNNGYLITPTGRMRRFGLFTPANEWRALNQAANFPISSTASDICLKAAINMHYWCQKTGLGKVLLLVHDSIYVQAREENAQVVSDQLEIYMLRAGEEVLSSTYIPMKVDVHVAYRWGDL